MRLQETTPSLPNYTKWISWESKLTDMTWRSLDLIMEFQLPYVWWKIGTMQKFLEIIVIILTMNINSEYGN